MRKLMSIFSLMTGMPGPTGFGSASTAERVTLGIDATQLTAIVSGGASGIGLETSRVLALRGAHVIIAARNLEAANEAKEVKENAKARVDVLKFDLSSLTSVHRFVDAFLALHLPLNILINKAGIMFCPYQKSADGIELQFATNHIGHFVLTNLLLDKMKQTAKTTGIQESISYSDKRAYGQSKLANILHANELSRRLQAEGANIAINSVHPGILRIFTYLFWKNVPHGAATSCYVALHPDLHDVSGKYYADCNKMSPSNFANDTHLAAKLWDLSNKIIDSIPR